MFNKLMSSMSIALFLLISTSNLNAANYQSQYSATNDPSYSIMEAVSKIKTFNGKSTNVPPAVIKSFLEKEIIPLFDFGSMARWITGPYVQYMTPEDQVEFYANLKSTFLSSLSNHLGSFDSENSQHIRGRARIFSWIGKNE